MNRRKFTRLIGLGAVGTVIISNMPATLAEEMNKAGIVDILSAEEMLKGFLHPPDPAKPWTYWMWLDGHISTEGITSDLEAMKQIGLGGALIMNLGLPPNEAILPGSVRFMSTEWRELVHHAISEATRLGIQINMNNDDGWNSGGPWISPDLAMQKLTWSETRIAGPVQFSSGLEQPATTLNTYHDVAVLAIPVTPTPQLPEAIRSIHQKEDGCWLQLDFGKKITAGSFTVTKPQLKPGNLGPASCELLVSDDGRNFQNVRVFETGWFSFTAPKRADIRLDKVQARYFRLLLPDVTFDPSGFDLTIDPESRLDHWQMKAGFTYIKEHGGGSPLYTLPAEFPASGNHGFPQIREVKDISKLMHSDGILEWNAPDGEWIILRVGYTPTGMKNGYATSEGKGLDSDKYNRKALEMQLSGMADKVIDDARSLVGKGLTMLHTDSWESGAANWTASFPEEFKKRRGYDIKPWLPVMVGGRVMESIDQSERFLWDVRRTIADIFIDNHLKYFRELSHKRGLSFSSESSGRQQFLYDPIAFQVSSDLPMGEFWNTPQELRPRPDCKAAASAAHVANRSIAGSEAFTQNQNNAGCWLETPYSLKALGDRAFCYGINRFYFHRMVLQDRPGYKPGMTWPKVGINFDASQTWWKPGTAWIEYLSRCQYLLQQGRFVADVAILTDEGAPASVIRQLKKRIDANAEYDTSTITEAVLRRYNQIPFLPPSGYDYDFVDAQSVQEMKVKNGSLFLSHGMSYKVLVLPPTERMSLQLARKVLALVKAGATVIGNKPRMSPTLPDYQKGDAELQAIARDLWGDNKQSTANIYGKGQVFSGNATARALEVLNIRPDFEYSISPLDDKIDIDIDYIHRKTETAHVYFISNQQKETVELNGTFRVTGLQPEIWMPDSGKVIKCTAFDQVDGRTQIPLQLDPSGSLFIIFNKPIGKKTKGTSKHNIPVIQPIQTIDGGWNLQFDTTLGGPEKYEMKKLQSWTKNTDEGIKFYSGTATYQKHIDIDRSLLKKGNPLYLDLGSVKELCSVRFNGKEMGVLWKPPFRLEITEAAREGRNLLEIAVTNLWPNRLIGDSGLPEEKRVASVNWNPFIPASPLLESGLIGPVTLQMNKQIS